MTFSRPWACLLIRGREYDVEGLRFPLPYQQIPYLDVSDDWDPTMQGLGTTRHTYAGNDPANQSDANGHLLDTIWDALDVLFDVSKIGWGGLYGNKDLMRDGPPILLSTPHLQPFPLSAGASKAGCLFGKAAKAGSEEVAPVVKTSTSGMASSGKQALDLSNDLKYQQTYQVRFC